MSFRAKAAFAFASMSLIGTLGYFILSRRPFDEDDDLDEELDGELEETSAA